LKLPRPTEFAHTLAAAGASPGDLLIDATLGKGTDTLLLAELAGSGGRVLAFDVQAAALDAAAPRLQAAGLDDRVQLILASHATLADHAPPDTAAVVMFNLGYLPGHSHEITTNPAETLRGLDAAATVLKPGGLLTVVCYPGHPGGDEESEAVTSWMQQRATIGWRVVRYSPIATLRPSPFLLAATKPDR